LIKGCKDKEKKSVECVKGKAGTFMPAFLYNIYLASSASG